MLVAVAFVRIVTNRKIFPNATPLSVALATIDELTHCDNCQLVGPTAQHWTIVSALCRQSNATGKLIADAQHAALAIEHGCEWVTRDRDFARFESQGLRWRHLITP